MAAFWGKLQHTTPRAESPAKVFAKLKSRVDREKEGVYPGRAPLGHVKEGRGAELESPRKKTDPYWATDEHRARGSPCDAQALTISPASSPQRDFGWSSDPAEDGPSYGARGHACTPRKSQPFRVASGVQSLAEPPRVKGGLRATRGTQREIRAADGEPFPEEARAPRTPPSSAFSPIRSRLRKRRTPLWGLNSERKASEGTRSGEPLPPNGFSGSVFVRSQLVRECVVPAVSSPARTRASVVDKVHLMSPAKMFAYMKGRDCKPEQQEGHKLAISTNLFGSRGICHQSTSPPAASVRGTEEANSISAVGSGSPASQSDTDRSEEFRVPTVLSHRLLLEDSLILTSPRVSIPKKRGPAYSNKNWPPLTDYQCENGIHLRQWFLKRKGKNLYVEGIHREKNIPWNSNIIMDRISNCVLKTITGNIYILNGKINLNANAGFPKWFLKKFHSGFPSNWNKLFEKFLSACRKKENDSKVRGSQPKTRSEAKFIAPPPSVKQTATPPASTSENHPPALLSSAKLSRSGRLIKPPLEYWKGGRVLMDAHMNVTIHESYDTSRCNAEANATVSLEPSARLFSPCGDESQPSKAAAAKDRARPPRKPEPPVLRSNRTGANHPEKPFLPPEAPPKPSSSSSSEVEHSRRQWPSPKGRALKQTQRPKGDARQQAESCSTLSKASGQKRAGRKPPASASGRTRSASSSQRSFDSEASSNGPSPPNESLAARRSQRRKGAPCSQEEELHDRKKKTSRTPRPGGAAKKSKQKGSRASASLGRAKPTQPSETGAPGRQQKKEEEEEEEEEQRGWNEEELMRLNEAVTLHPHHIGDHWARVALAVGTRSAEECHQEYALGNVLESPARKRTKKSDKAKGQETGSQASQDKPVISARAGTLKRKQQVRHFLENMAKGNNNDIFALASMKTKAFERATSCPFNTTNNHEFTLSDLGPLTPGKATFPLVKTPNAGPISPDMLGSPNCTSDDKFVYHLQKRVKKNQINACKLAPTKSLKLTPSAKRAVQRRGKAENDDFVWEMFPGRDSPTVLSDSEEEIDFYFSDSD